MTFDGLAKYENITTASPNCGHITYLAMNIYYLQLRQCILTDISNEMTIIRRDLGNLRKVMLDYMTG